MASLEELPAELAQQIVEHLRKCHDALSVCRASKTLYNNCLESVLRIPGALSRAYPWSVAHNDFKLVRRVMQLQPSYVKEETLYAACGCGSSDVITEILKHNHLYDPEIIGRERYHHVIGRAVARAMSARRTNIVRRLLALPGIEVDELNRGNYKTPLDTAAAMASSDMFFLLLEISPGLCLAPQRPSRLAPVLDCVARGHVTVAEHMIKAGAGDGLPVHDWEAVVDNLSRSRRLDRMMLVLDASPDLAYSLPCFELMLASDMPEIMNKALHPDIDVTLGYFSEAISDLIVGQHISPSVDMAKVLLGRGVPVMRSSRGWTPLQLAVQTPGRVEFVKLLYDRPIITDDVVSEDQHYCLMHKAADSAILAYLLDERGHDLEERDGDGNTPLLTFLSREARDAQHWDGTYKSRASNGTMAMLDMFIARGADLGVVSGRRSGIGSSHGVLELAVLCMGDCRMVERLIDIGTQLTIPGFLSRRHVVRYIANLGYHDAVRMAKKLFDTKISLSAQHQEEEEEESESDIEDEHDRTQLWYAVATRKPDVVRIFLDMGADPNAHDRHGLNALHCHHDMRDVRTGFIKCLRLVLNAGATLRAREATGYVTMPVADTPELLQLLIDYGFDVSKPVHFPYFHRQRYTRGDADFVTGVLHFATLEHNMKLVKMALAHGADPALRDSDANRAWEMPSVKAGTRRLLVKTIEEATGKKIDEF